MTADPSSGQSAALLAFVAAVLADVDEGAVSLNALDGIAGDGDLGLTVHAAASAIGRLATDGPPPADVSGAIRAIGSELARSAPSTAGTLVAFACLAAAAADPGDGTVGAGELGLRLRAAADSIARRGKSAVGEKTMLDALDPAATAASAVASEGASLVDAIAAAARAADAGAIATAEMTAVHGRAGWLKERAAGHEDAGARLVALLLEAAARRIRAR